MKTLHLSGTPNPKQQAFFLSTAPHTAYGGARGGGKSWAMRRKLVLLALRYPGLNELLLRRTLPELQENHVLPLLKELSGCVSYHQTQRCFTFPNGSRIKLGYCDKEADVFQYQGQEYDVIGMEEATHFTESQMQFLTTCNRSTRGDFAPRMYYTCNPGGPGHEWVKRLFIDRRYGPGERAQDYAFIPARLTDNRVLMDRDPGYYQKLLRLPEHLKRAYLDGDWDVLSGRYFPEFSQRLHVKAPFAIPTWWRRFRAMDWGYNDPCCVLWLAVSPEGQIIVYRELYVRQMLSSQVAKKVRELTGGEKMAYTVASPDAWQQRGLPGAQGDCIADVFQKNGVPLIPADNRRIHGWQRLRECLAPGADGAPGLVIFEGCRELIRTLPLLTYDERDHEDVSDRCEDHAPEALRYGVMSRHPKAQPPAQKPRPGYDPFSGPAPQRGGFASL